MTDNELIQIFRPIILAGLTTAGYGSVPIIKSFQQARQGVEDRLVYFYKIGDHRYGTKSESDEWDEINSLMIHTYRQYYETTFQVGALVKQNVADITLPTASDLLNIVAMSLQNQSAINSFMDAGVGILRVTDVRNSPAFLDDFDQHEYAPSFDFTLLHEQVAITTEDVISSVNFVIARV